MKLIWIWNSIRTETAPGSFLLRLGYSEVRAVRYWDLFRLEETENLSRSSPNPSTAIQTSRQCWCHQHQTSTLLKKNTTKPWKQMLSLKLLIEQEKKVEFAVLVSPPCWELTSAWGKDLGSSVPPSSFILPFSFFYFYLFVFKFLSPQEFHLLSALFPCFFF